MFWAFDFAAASWSAVLCTAFFGSFQFFKILFIHVPFFTVPDSAPESGEDSRTPRRSRGTRTRLGKGVHPHPAFGHLLP